MSRTPRGFWFEPNAMSVEELRDMLIGSPTGGLVREGGLPGKFKAACRVALWHWRRKYLPFHFTPHAYSMYGYPQPAYHKEHKYSLRGLTVTRKGQTLTPPYSGKQYRQAMNRIPVTRPDLPLVFSGNTREAALHGPFRTFGTATRVISGAWGGGGMCWAWLNKMRLRGCSINRISPMERDALFGVIARRYNYFRTWSSHKVPRDDASLSALAGW